MILGNFGGSVRLVRRIQAHTWAELELRVEDAAADFDGFSLGNERALENPVMASLARL